MPPPSVAADNLPKTNLPDQGLPPIPAAQDAAAVLASPPSSSLAAAAAGTLPAVAKAATNTSAADPKAGAALAGSLKTPLSAQKTPLHQQQLQTIVKNPAAKMIRFESKRQYKQRVCTDKMIQKQGVLGCKNTTMTNKK